MAATSRRNKTAGTSPTAPRGFTLIELLFTLVILALLVALLLPSVRRAGGRRGARNARTTST